MHGEGEYTYVSGDVYRGVFEKGKKHGQGEYFFKASESTFMGRWSEGAFEEGVVGLLRGSSRIVRRGKPTGEGTYTWSASGNTQTGEWGADGAFIGGAIKAAGVV